MSWTTERVERLTKLWAEGLSASQIAADLGGVTRNAVIGKVHRLGLSGRARATPKQQTAAPRRKASPRTAGAGFNRTATTNATAAARTTTTAARAVGNTALKVEVEIEVEEELQPVTKPAEDVVVPISRKLTLMELSESTCKWPTGDPTRPGFSFCGHTCAEGKPYCEYHSKVAFQPTSERRRRR
ncbi:MAG: GcrA family cell cycle regulator [Pseudomonadota bacterium]